MIKRAMDIVLALIGLVLLSPLFLVLSLLAGFYVQERVGRLGRTFRMFKFRTMVRGADRLGPSLTVGGDKRITRIGSVLRRTKLDELPQLWNVLIGDMSFVGPRPEVERYVNLYNSEQKQVLNLRPGITDLASFAYFNESEILQAQADPENFYIRQIMPDKIRINLAYSAKGNVGRDLLLITATVLRALGIKLDLFSWLGIAPP